MTLQKIEVFNDTAEGVWCKLNLRTGLSFKFCVQLQLPRAGLHGDAAQRAEVSEDDARADDVHDVGGGGDAAPLAATFAELAKLLHQAAGGEGV